MHLFTADILASKKYHALYPPTVERVVQSCLKRYKEADVAHEAKNILHQVWGAYYGIRPNFEKLLKNFKTVESALLLHASTAERLPFLKEFYARIFSVTGPVKSIVDYGCGFSPLAYASLNLAPEYFGFDIDTEEVAFLKAALAKLECDRDVHVAAGDVLTDPPYGAEVAFFLKLLPPLEQQEKGVSRRILEAQTASWLVVSYPLSSLSGKEKGMREFYTNSLYRIVEDTDWEVTELEFPTELVFVIKK